MVQRFYKRYHPHAAYRTLVPRVYAERKHFHFSYLLDIQAVFHPALSDCKLLKRIIFSFSDVISTEEKQKHCSTVHSYIWRTISRQVQQVAYNLVINTTSETEQPVVPVCQAKYNKSKDPTLALLETMIPTNQLQQGQDHLAPHDHAENEIKFYQNIDKSEWPKF